MRELSTPDSSPFEGLLPGDRDVLSNERDCAETSHGTGLHFTAAIGAQPPKPRLERTRTADPLLQSPPKPLFDLKNVGSVLGHPAHRASEDGTKDFTARSGLRRK